MFTARKSYQRSLFIKRLSRSLAYFSVALATVVVLARLLLGGGTAYAEVINKPLPEFTQASPAAWLNSKPLVRTDLLGKVLLIDVWTFDCWNCYRSFPWLHEIEARYQSKGLQVMGIHSPEFAHEAERGRLEAKIAEFKIEHPVMMDNDFAYWQRLKNRFWPSFYLVDKQGVIRQRFIGEMHSGTSRTEKIEREIQLLLAESP